MPTLQFRNNLFLGSTRGYLTELGDPHHHNLFSKLSGIIVPLGFIYVTAVGYVLDTYGFAISGHVVNVLGVTYGIFQCIPELWAQPIASFFFAAYRALLFSYVAAFTAVVFGSKSVGRCEQAASRRVLSCPVVSCCVLSCRVVSCPVVSCPVVPCRRACTPERCVMLTASWCPRLSSPSRITGVLYTTTAFFILLQTPMIHWTSHQLHNNYFPLHLIDVTCVAIPIVMTFWIQRSSKEVGRPPKEEEEDGAVDAEKQRHIAEVMEQGLKCEYRWLLVAVTTSYAAPHAAVLLSSAVASVDGCDVLC